MDIFIKAKPGARENKIEKIDETHFTVWVMEPPREGRANRAIIGALANYFDVAPSRIRLISGFASREKVFEIINKIINE